jgi:hypothetical protein
LEKPGKSSANKGKDHCQRLGSEIRGSYGKDRERSVSGARAREGVRGEGKGGKERKIRR